MATCALPKFRSDWCRANIGMLSSPYSQLMPKGMPPGYRIEQQTGVTARRVTHHSVRPGSLSEPYGRISLDGKSQHVVRDTRYLFEYLVADDRIRSVSWQIKLRPLYPQHQRCLPMPTDLLQTHLIHWLAVPGGVASTATPSGR